jgi:hypothetical protein
VTGHAMPSSCPRSNRRRCWSIPPADPSWTKRPDVAALRANLIGGAAMDVLDNRTSYAGAVANLAAFETGQAICVVP